MFVCPACRCRLDTQRNPKGLFWACPSCGGRSATVMVLRKLFPGELVNAMWQRARVGPHSFGRHCPACANPMDEVPVPGMTDHHVMSVFVGRECLRCGCLSAG